MRVMGVKASVVLIALIAYASYSKRLKWAALKSQQIVFKVVN
jgi:hypothetical protein